MEEVIVEHFGQYTRIRSARAEVLELVVNGELLEVHDGRGLIWATRISQVNSLRGADALVEVWPQSGPTVMLGQGMAVTPAAPPWVFSEQKGPEH